MTRASRRKSKPSAPRRIETAETEGAAQELAEARREVVRMKSVGCEAKVAHEKQEDGSIKWVARGNRLDVFALLLSRKALDKDAHDAFRDHEETVHVAAGWATPERRPDHIRASTEGAPGQNISQGMIVASRMVKATLDRLSPSEGRLLDALMGLGASGLTQWRHTVQRVTGENNDHGQASRIRALGENLIWARRSAMKALIRAANDDRTVLDTAAEYAKHAANR
jgi:hypothetical protein